MKAKQALGAILIMVLLLGGLPGLAMGVSWQDPNIRTITKLNWLDMVSNLSWKDLFIRYNRSESLLECEVQFGANDTLSRATSANECAQMVRANLTKGGNISVPSVSTPHGLVAFVDALGHTFEDTGVLISSLLTSFAPAIKEMEDQMDFNLTHWFNEGNIAHLFNDTHWVNLVLLGEEFNRTHDFNEGQLAASQNITESMPLAGNTSFPATSTPGGILTFLDALGHSFQDSLWTIAGLLLEVDNRNVANNTHWFNEGTIAADKNITEAMPLAGNTSVPDTSTPNGVVIFADALGHTFADSGRLLSEFLTTFAPVIKEMENQQAANDTLTKGASVKLCTDRLEENQTTIKGAAVRVCDDHIGTNITTTATLSPMAYQFVVPASGGAAYSAPIEGASGNIWVPVDFDGTTSEAAVADILLPADYSVGFTETYSWTATSTGGGGVVWGMELACISDNVAMDASWGTQILVTDTFQTSGALHISGASASTTPSGSCAAGRTLAIRVKRMPAEAGDTMSDDARFLGLQLTYTKAGA